jgi:hypothetical protein
MLRYFIVVLCLLESLLCELLICMQGYLLLFLTSITHVTKISQNGNPQIYLPRHHKCTSLQNYTKIIKNQSDL